MTGFRLIAYAFLGIAALNSAKVVAQQSTRPANPPAVTDPLAKELERCKALADQAVSDERCRAAYKENRRRFFQPPSAYQPPPVHIDPDVRDPKLVKPDQPQAK